MATQADFDRLSNWALMLNPDADIDRRKCRRSVPMEVLSLGLARTGTLSMQEALKILGHVNTYHYSSIFANVQDADMWNEALRAKYKGRGKPFGRRDGLFLARAAGAYPDVKVVLVERDEDKWYKSCCILLDGVLDRFGRYVLRFTDPYWFGKIITCGGLWVEGLLGSLNPRQAKANARAAYRKHNADIRATVRKERLLEYRLGSGWEPLCTFLEKDVPKVPFPNRNDSKTLEISFKYLAGKTIRRSLTNIAVVVGTGAVVGGLLWSYILI
ncbi:hypothetical protein LTS02_017829 [Friedmanniomyces endolithicus]|nr:hypothetical protein LTS02_017829 [Friedmanniomyces endolithicus]